MLIRVLKSLPLVQQARVDLAYERAKPVRYVIQFLVHRFGGNVLSDALEHVRQIAQKNTLTLLQSIVTRVLTERHRPFEHLSCNRFWLYGISPNPGMLGAELIEVCVNPVLHRPGWLNLAQTLHTLLVLDA